jgi:hypothetical protein
MRLVRVGAMKVVEVLLEAGADPMVRDCGGNTAIQVLLSAVCGRGHSYQRPMLMELLDKLRAVCPEEGDVINAVNDAGETPIFNI